LFEKNIIKVKNILVLLSFEKPQGLWLAIDTVRLQARDEERMLHRQMIPERSLFQPFTALPFSSVVLASPQ
jgi:hypothetical protein